jgi:hypothetical protein
MNDDRSSAWQSMGTSFIWDSAALDEATTEGTTVSLREVFPWAHAMPDDPPGGVRTVVVTGLLTVLDVLPPDERDVVLGTMRTLARQQSRRWPEAAIVFSMPDQSRFLADAGSGEVRLKLATGVEIELGRRVWGGASADAHRIVAARLDAKGKESDVPIGYWLRRVS